VNGTTGPDISELAELWREVLNLDSVDEDTDFFKAGGDSFQLVRVVAKARSRGWVIPVPTFMGNPTLGALAEALRSGVGERSTVTEREIPAEFPLLPSQVRLLEWRTEDHAAYSTTLVVSVDDSVHRDAVAEALDVLAERHAALRTVFPGGVSGRRARLADVRAAFRFWRRSAADVAPGGQAEYVAGAIAELERAIDPTRGPLWGCLLVEHLDRGGLLCLVFHQLVADGRSVEILVEDFQDAYAAVVGSRRLEADDPATGAATVIHACEIARRAEADGEEAVSTLLERPWHHAVRLPRARTGVAAATPTVQRLVRVVGKDVTHRFIRSQQHVAVSSEEVLIAAVALAVGSVAGSDTVGIAVNRSGRTALTDEYDLTRAVGYLVLSTPYLLELPVPGTARGLHILVEQARTQQRAEAAWGALRYVAESSDRVRGIAEPEVHLVYRGVERNGWRDPFRPCWFQVNEPRTGSLPYLVSVYADVVADELRMSWIYGEDLVSERTVVELAEATVQRLGDLLTGTAA
jgi:aryl carrier-like protein